MSCFSGGYTHANILNSMRVWYRVTSKDIASSYPAVMVTEKLPQGEFLKCRVSDYTPKKQKYYAFMLNVFGTSCFIVASAAIVNSSSKFNLLTS